MHALKLADPVLFLSTLSLRRATTIMQNVIFMPRKFLSTLSLRRATLSGALCGLIIKNFYPRSPCGERPLRQLQSALRRDFYPRSPCGERRMTHTQKFCV